MSYENNYSGNEQKRTPQQIAQMETLLAQVDGLEVVVTPSTILKDAPQDYLREIQSPEWIAKQAEKTRQVAALMPQMVGNELPYRK